MKRKEAIQILQIYKDELEQRINEADDSDVKDVYQWQVDGFYMAIEALQEAEINCVHCPYYYETEDETGVHSHCGSHGRLIDADALVRSIRLDISITGKENAETVANVLNEIMAKIAGAPTVQADRPHGEWVRRDNYKVMGEGYIWHCSICDEKVYQDSSRDYPSDNFCPNCGADMRKEKE